MYANINKVKGGANLKEKYGFVDDALAEDPHQENFQLLGYGTAEVRKYIIFCYQ
jgi:hypothetical protein